MEIEVFANADAVAQAGARFIAAAAPAALAARGRFLLAVSGGQTPWQMLRALAEEPLPWSAIHLFQVDERVAPSGDTDRNLTHLAECLAGSPAASRIHLHPMPVEAGDLDGAAREYALDLARIAGAPPILDLIHLGLGPDGHTASLVPGDPVLEVSNAEVALTGVYQSRRRMTLTYPALNRARQLLWVITGSEKADALARLRSGDPSIPAGRIEQGRACVLADSAAARQVH
ncbi:MAG: 6-phosphogluconolactonase [Planctomycetaceae bacterium]|nr:6-phosphogluconolactonase [Planctomycetaceae bacterium]